jgi:hypothetical protein
MAEDAGTEERLLRNAHPIVRIFSTELTKILRGNLIFWRDSAAGAAGDERMDDKGDSIEHGEFVLDVLPNPMGGGFQGRVRHKDGKVFAYGHTLNHAFLTMACSEAFEAVMEAKIIADTAGMKHDQFGVE